MYNLHFRPTLRFGHDLSVLKTTQKESRTRHTRIVRETRQETRERTRIDDDDDNDVEENEIL